MLTCHSEFEHKGRKISLAGEAEQKAYIAERRANYPTQARIAEKQARAKAEQEARREKNKRLKREANAKKLLDKADKEGKVTFEIFTVDPRNKKVIDPIKQEDRATVEVGPDGVKVEAEEGASTASAAPQPTSDSKDPRILVAYLEEQLKSAPEMLVAYLKEQLKLAKDAVAASDIPSATVVKGEDSSSSEGSSVMSESDSDSDAPPEETSIKPQVPVSVPPPKREATTAKPKPI